jgi:hypothetical protein
VIAVRWWLVLGGEARERLTVEALLVLMALQ